MKTTRTDIMGMPITIESVGGDAPADSIDAVFAYFVEVDTRFSTYNEASEISRINRGEVPADAYSPEMREVIALAERTKQATDGYFDIRRPDGWLDPSGIVKGWAIRNGAALLVARGHAHFCIDAGGDIASRGTNADGKPWSIGIRNPFAYEEIVRVVYPNGAGVATSGNAARGNHVYNPHEPATPPAALASITVIGPDVLEADRFATAAFAMGERGITFVESLDGFEGYAIAPGGIATMTSGFDSYTRP